MIYGAGQEYIAQGFLLLMAGIPVYVYIKWRNAKNAAEAARGDPTGAYRRRPSLGRRSRRWVDDRMINHLHPTQTTLGSATAPQVGRRIRGWRAAAVLLHRPGIELKRLTPTNKDDLLFDDVLWVKRARQEHDAFADALVERGVEVLYLRAC